MRSPVVRRPNQNLVQRIYRSDQGADGQGQDDGMLVAEKHVHGVHMPQQHQSEKISWKMKTRLTKKKKKSNNNKTTCDKRIATDDYITERKYRVNEQRDDAPFNVILNEKFILASQPR